MAHDEQLAERIRDHVVDVPEVGERSMFGGRATFVAGNMACCVSRETTFFRVPRDAEEDLLATDPEARPKLSGAGHRMRGWIELDNDVLADDEALRAWVDRGIAMAASLPPK